MEFLGFTFSVWAAIALGVFFFAMAIACTSDRGGSPGAKWVIVFLGIVVGVAWNWKTLSWGLFTSAPFWKSLGIYLAIGLAYSVVEGWFKVRKEARAWNRNWESFKEDQKRRFATEQPPKNSTLEERFMGNGRTLGNGSSIVEIHLDSNKQLTPVVNRSSLAQWVGCWTAFWPAYAVSLLIGDFMTEVCRRFADLLAALSSGFVRRMFAKTFKP